MIYERKLSEKIRKWIDKKAIIVVTGMRRVGKTTLFKILYDEIKSKNKVFLDIENPITQRLFQEKDYDNILINLKQRGITDKEKSYIFLDEIQAFPDIVKVIKYLFDHYNIQFFVTGSSSFYLKNLFPESLAGRKIIFELYPLDFEEFLAFKNTKKDFYPSFKQKDKHKNYISHEKTIKLFEEYLRFGGFPQVVLSDKIDEKKEWLEDIFKSYFEKEVRNLADFRDINILREFILLLMQRAGSKLNINNISEELGVTRKTLYSYLLFLEATYFVRLISPFSRNVGREVTGTKKVYICDSGLLNHFAKVSSGNILENAVFNIIKNFDEIKYYQRRTGTEIDFILKNKKIALEVKETGTLIDKKKLNILAKSLRLKENYILTKSFKKEKGFIDLVDL